MNGWVEVVSGCSCAAHFTSDCSRHRQGGQRDGRRRGGRHEIIKGLRNAEEMMENVIKEGNWKVYVQ